MAVADFNEKYGTQEIDITTVKLASLKVAWVKHRLESCLIES